MNLSNFVYNYYIYPVITFQYQYNLINSTTYYVLFFLGIYLLYKYFYSKNKIEIKDKYFLLNLILTINLFIFPRTLMDLGYLYKTYFLLTPFIEIYMILLFLPNLFLFKYRKNIFYFLLAINIVVISSLLNYINFIYIFQLPVFLIIIPLIIYFSLKENLIPLSILGEFLDGLSTYIGIGLRNYGEEHIIPHLIMEYYGLNYFLIIKILFSVIIVLLVYYSKDIFNQKEKNIIYFTIFLLGFLPGLRDCLLVLL